MYYQASSIRLPLALAAALVLPACAQRDSKPDPKKARAEKKAKADEALEKRKREREQKRAAEEEAKAALAAKVDALAVVPDAIPKKLDKACAQLLEGYDGFMRRVLKGDQLTKWTTGGNEMQLAVFKKECLKRTPTVAACQAFALTRAGPELELQLPDLMKRCDEKFGAGPAE